MNGDQDRLLVALHRVDEAGGTLQPRWNPALARGFEYVCDGTAIDDLVATELGWLADRGYLDRVFVDRLGRCPICSSFHLNFREVCPTCQSPNLDSAELLHHFRCGHVAPAGDFAFDGEARRCPKCHGRLRDRGSDHDVPGPHFTCRSCGISFQMPEVGVLCLSCEHRIDAAQLSTLVYETVEAYRLTSLGRAALKDARMFRDEAFLGLTEPHLPGVYRQSVLMSFVDDEERRQRRFRAPFAVLLLNANFATDFGGASESAQAANTGEQQLVARVREFLNDTDKLGTYEHGSFVVLLPGAKARDAKRLAQRLVDDPMLAAWSLRAAPIALREGTRIVESLAMSLKALGNHA